MLVASCPRPVGPEGLLLSERSGGRRGRRRVPLRCGTVDGMRVAAESAPDEPGPSAGVAAAHGSTRAVVLVLHGGQETSRQAASPTGPSALRILPFAWDLSRRLRGRGVAVWRLHYRYRGWNGSDASPVTDTRWALDEVRRRYGQVPVLLLGHSMGGRVAVNVADDPSVCELVLLAPWLPAGEPIAAVAGRRLLILHGDRDRTTSLAASQAWAARAQTTASAVAIRRIQGGEHTMLRHARTWHRLTVQAVVGGLRDLEHPPN